MRRFELEGGAAGQGTGVKIAVKIRSRQQAESLTSNISGGGSHKTPNTSCSSV